MALDHLGSGTAAALLWLAAFRVILVVRVTLGTAIGLMMWMWISAMVIIAGAELNAELECPDPSIRKQATGRFGRK